MKKSLPLGILVAFVLALAGCGREEVRLPPKEGPPPPPGMNRAGQTKFLTPPPLPGK